MKKFLMLLLTMSMAVSSAGCKGSETAEGEPKGSVHGFVMTTIDGEQVSLSKYEGKTLIIVNTASKCGYTPQYEQLQAFYEKWNDKGVVVLGFPANNFGGQEPGTDKEIRQFCTKNFGVTFPMFSKISVKGDDQHPLYQYLTEKKQNGVLDTRVTWNFNKFLVNEKGQIVKKYNSGVEVTSDEFTNDVKKLLNG